MADLISTLTSNPINLLIVVGVVGAAIYYKFRDKFKGEKKPLSRADAMRKKLVEILSVNRSKTMILMQKENLIGLTSHYASYDNEGTKMYLILFSPIWFGKIPKFWKSEPMITSSDFIEAVDRKEENNISFMGKKINMGNKIFSQFILKEAYFIDKFFGVDLDLTDGKAKDFLKLRLGLDEMELKSSAYLAQGMKLSIVDFKKIFEPTQEEATVEKIREVEVERKK